MLKLMPQNYFFYVTTLIILLPLLALGYKGLSTENDTFGFLVINVLDDVLINSLAITLMTSIGVLSIGISTAWFTSQYSFWGRRIFQTALFMPLAFPAYILAYVYTDFFDEAGQFSLVLKSYDLNFFVPDVRTVWGASFILTFCLYPYVYLFARSGFLAGSQNQIENASLLGADKWSQFFDIALPSARPFIFVGLMLVIMEVMADYGTMDYFGIKVFSTVIYDSWAGYGDITAAARLSVFLLTFVLVLVFLEKKQREKMRFYTGDRPESTLKPTKTGNVFMSVFCFLPVFIGFVFPILIMLKMMFETIDSLQVMTKTLPYLYNTLLSSFLVALFGVLIAFVLAAQKRQKPNTTKNILYAFCGFGYALPGIILGLGLLLMSSFFSTLGFLVTGTFVFLIMGYLIRFLNVALQGIDAGYDKMSPSISEASQLMQRSPFEDFWHVKLPLLRPSMISAGLVLAVEVIKELPLTLVLRPFNFDTLAVYTYNLASDERLAEAVFPALCIVIAGCIPVLLLQKLSRSP
ncbi:MAG: ABC transporter permease subunit [Alphaproteobacteria bacterium]|nr:ABC transporter permease subunit [Alphaproteobacteria bacterium]